MFTVQTTWWQQVGKTASVGLCPSMTLKSSLVKRTVCLWSFWLGLGFFNSLATLSSFSITRGRTCIWWHLLHNTKYSAITPKQLQGCKQWCISGNQHTHAHMVWNCSASDPWQPASPTAPCFCRYLAAEHYHENTCSSDGSLSEQKAVQSLNVLYALNSRGYTEISG